MLLEFYQELFNSASFATHHNLQDIGDRMNTFLVNSSLPSVSERDWLTLEDQITSEDFLYGLKETKPH